MIKDVLDTPTINQVDLSYAEGRYAVAIQTLDGIDVEITDGSLREIEEQNSGIEVYVEVSDEAMLDRSKLLLEIKESASEYVCGKEKADAMDFSYWEACEQHYRFVEGIE